LVPHAVWAFGPVAAYSDWVHVEEHVGASGAKITSDAVSVIPTVVLTGEDAEPLRYVVPRHPLDLSRGHIGALLLVGGVGWMRIGDAAFTSGAADPAVAMRGATVYGGGLNWYPYRGLALLIDYGHLVFDAFGAAPRRPDEDVLVARFQMAL